MLLNIKVKKQRVAIKSVIINGNPMDIMVKMVKMDYLEILEEI
jgi:hypothetical protein